MNDSLFEKIDQIAKEIKISPKLLLYSLAAICHNVSEIQMLRCYIFSLSEEIMYSSDIHCNSVNLKVRRSAEMSFLDISASEKYALKQKNDAILRATNFFDFSKPIQGFQYSAWKIAVTEIEDFEKLRPSHLRKKFSFLYTVKELCKFEFSFKEPFPFYFHVADLYCNE